MHISLLNNMELLSMNAACKPLGSKSYCFVGPIKPSILRMDRKLGRNVQVYNLPKQKTVTQVFNNDATQSSTKSCNEHELRPSTTIRKDCDPSKIETNGDINGLVHFANQKIISPMLGGQGILNETSMVERTIIQEEQGSNVPSKIDTMYSLEDTNCASPTNFDLKATYHASWGATSGTVQDATTNGLYKQGHQPSTPMSSQEGLGIVEFLRRKTLLVTGATGFLGKVLIEKILRVQPDVEHIFLLIRAKDVDHAKSRLEKEIMHSTLFQNLQSLHGASYQNFMESKLSPILGSLAKDNLGMDVKKTSEIQEKVEIIVNSAASTTFDERYDHALNLNTKGAQRITEFANHCPKIQLLMQVSTAFVNGKREGVIEEKTFKVGCSIANEISSKGEDTVPDIHVDEEVQLVKRKVDELLLGAQREEALKDLGIERAKKFGWQDTYVFTKALAEMMVDSTRDRVPVVIIRPSVVESSFKDPFPGWLEGNRMMDPVITLYGKGRLPGFLADPHNVLDVVPVDMVANAMLAAMARHANKSGIEVYQVASSMVNPLVYLEFARASTEHFRDHPIMDKFGKPLATFEFELFYNMESFMDAVTTCCHSLKDSISSGTNAKELTLKIKQHVAYLVSLYQPYTFYGGRFDTSKTEQLFASLSSQEKEVFGFDVGEISWANYIKTIHIPGLRKHVWKGRGSII